MAAFVRQTCSTCGAVFPESSGAGLTRCPICQSVLRDDGSSPDRQSQPEPKRDAAKTILSQPTVILGGDTEPDLPHQAVTVDFVPSSEKTEPSPHVAARPVKKVRIGRFEVTSVLGNGSFGTVYRAHDPLLDREVALKVPRFTTDEDASLERFHREAKAAARLHHPNIVTLYENGQAETGPYLVSEFVDGIPLNQLLREQRLELQVAVDLVRQIAEALNYAHGEGIVHRDVKPSNIMMNRAGRPQVMDFGLAKRDADIEAGMTVEGQIVGTPNYMSPEQARGAIAEIGPHSDQYSVGVVLYEMICGRPPFAGDPWTIIARVANVRENPPAPRTVNPDLPRDLEACCLKAMEKEPKSRYPTLQALADDLDHWLKGLPLVARPIGPMERFVRWCRHNRMIASLVGTIATLLLIAGIVGPWLAVRFRELAADAKRDANAAEVARDAEKKARLATERSIIDSYTETGLTAHRNGDPREAILWFANAAAVAENYPSRERHNRIRVQSWLSQIAVPVQAFAMPPAWKETLAYHPSGRWLLSLTNSGECELLQVSDGTRRAIPIQGPITAVTFSKEGTRLAAATDRDVTVFEFAGWTPLSDRPGVDDQTNEFTAKELDLWTHSDSVKCLQFSDDGELLVLGGDTSVQVRDVSKKSFRTDSVELGSRVTSTAISDDGRRFAVRCKDDRVRVFSSAPDQRSSETLLPVLSSASEGNVPPMFAGNDRVVVIDNYQSVSCWNIDAQKLVWEYKLARVLSSAMSPCGKWIALGEDGDLVLLEAATGNPVEQRITHPNLINNIAFHPSRPLVLTGSVDHSARIFEVPSGKPIGLPIPHSDSVHRCVWSPDGTTFATVHWTGDLIRVWKPSDPKLDQFEIAGSVRAPFVRLNDRGDRGLPSSFDSGRNRTKVEVFDVTSGKTIGPVLSGPGLISDADFIPKSPLIVLVGGGSLEDAGQPLPEQKWESPGFVRFVNSETGKPAFPDLSTPSQPNAVRTSPDGRTVVVLCHQGQLLLLDATTGQLRAEHQAFNVQSAVYGFVIRDRIRFSERGDQFAVWGCDSLAELRKTDSGELIAELRHESGFIHDARFSPDGKLLATCSSDSNVRLWDTATGASNGQPLVHSGWVFNAQFSRDGGRLLTASEDKQARIWDLKTRTAMLTTREHGDQVFGVTFLPGEELFLAATRDGQITAWGADHGKMIAPARSQSGMIYQLSRGGSGSQVIASGQIGSMFGFDWRQWILEPDMQLSRDDVRRLGELLSSQRIHESGAATTLTSAEWIDRWNTFREKHPDYPALKAPKSVAINE